MAYNKVASQRYYAAHPERARAASARWRAANRQRAREASKAWRMANPERNKETTKAWRLKNKVRWNTSKRIWSAKNAERINRMASERRTANHAAYLEKERKYKAANIDRIRLRVRQNNLKNRYGLTLEEYDALLASQGGGCAICSRKTKDRSFPVDHDHVTGHIRGILCSLCNCGLGSFKESRKALLAALKYLKKGAAR